MLPAAGRLIDIVTALYLAITLLVLVATRRSVIWPIVATAHIAALVGITQLPRCSFRFSHVLRDWYPLVLLPLLYAEIPMLNEAFLSEGRDRWMASVESAIFHTEPARRLAQEFASRGLSEVLHIAYLSYYVIIYVPPALLLFAGGRHAFRETLFVLMFTYYCSYLIFILVPIRGPWDLWPVSPTVPDGLFRTFTIRILEAGSSPGAAFPSSHVAAAVAQTLSVTRHMPRAAPIFVLSTSLIAVAAVYGSFHYAVDVIAGALFGLATTWAARRLFTRLNA